jgi:hypothetical protein
MLWYHLKIDSCHIDERYINDFYFLEFFLKNFLFGVLYQAVRAVSKNQPKYPMLDIPLKFKVSRSTTGVLSVIDQKFTVVVSTETEI